MKFVRYTFFACCALLISNTTVASHSDNKQSSYNTALSTKEVNAYLTGSNLNFTKVAETNHYPNPKRVLQLKDELGLDIPQKNRTTVLYKIMRKYAIKAGREIVQKEEELNLLFQQENVDLDAVKSLVAEIAGLQGELRFIHLKATVAQKNFLSENQIATYFKHRDIDNLPVYAFDE